MDIVGVAPSTRDRWTYLGNQFFDLVAGLESLAVVKRPYLRLYSRNHIASEFDRRLNECICVIAGDNVVDKPEGLGFLGTN